MSAPAAANQPDSVSVALAREYPNLWESAEKFDFAERLGGCTDDLLREIDSAMHELWSARHEVARLRKTLGYPRFAR